MPETQNKDLLIIFIRNPEAGKVKKRLAASIGEDRALKIYQHLLMHTMEITRELPVTKEVHYSEKIDKNDIWDNSIFEKHTQKGDDLGERMENAFAQGFQRGYKSIIIIGSDMYDLGENDLMTAFSAMKKFPYIIGPAKDGGYYLLGMKTFAPHLFKDKQWGTSKVLGDTLEDLGKEKVFLMELRNDIDTFEDLKDHPGLNESII
ncbi:MAG TPA: TIGR04282 family arsenosugar biosynthesis glycosyltransferase [Salinimicrobium sp.]|nr:TIGR04282 family arsenosugar biosynthesis glycosyltransferase [Salinimicrobium sp.]